MRRKRMPGRASTADTVTLLVARYVESGGDVKEAAEAAGIDFDRAVELLEGEARSELEKQVRWSKLTPALADLQLRDVLTDPNTPRSERLRAIELAHKRLGIDSTSRFFDELGASTVMGLTAAQLEVAISELRGASAATISLTAARAESLSPGATPAALPEPVEANRSA